MKNKKTLLIPSMLDFHFPLLKFAFCSKKFNPVVLECSSGITDIGLKYTHNDLCYPAVLIIGQMICALQSGDYNLDNTVLLIPQAGDACRGSNYIHAIRKAMEGAGFRSVPIISLNAMELEKDNRLDISLSMIRRAAAAVIFGDMLMILKNQLLSAEVVKGETQQYIDKWFACLGNEIQNGRITFSSIKNTLTSIAQDFKNIKLKNVKCMKIGIVGELYVKYCHLGNRCLEDFLREQSCTYMINGFSWYMLYYIDTHLTDGNAVVSIAYKAAFKYLADLQKAMVKELKNNGFECLDEYITFKKNAENISPFGICTADGWLISCEAVNMIKSGYDRILGVQPFGCMPNHVCGKGQYPKLQRLFPDARIVSVDYDSSDCEINIRNRIKMLWDLDWSR